MDSLTTESARQALRHVYWIGGSPCSGKSTIARSLEDNYGVLYYSCDDAYFRHQKKTTPAAQPVFYRVSKMTWEQIWLRPVEELLADEIAVYREEFAWILQDLAELPGNRPVVAEGAALLPELVAPLLSSPHQAAWVVPSPCFQRCHYGRRAWAQDIVKETSNPQQAFENWMERDARFARWVHQEAQARGLLSMVVDGEKTVEENIQVIEEHFRLPG